MLHKGHRSRVRANILRNGTDAFEVHELFEALLFYSIPYRDTNPTAHLLCNAFGAPLNVFRAKTEELCALSGIGGATADFLHLCATLSDAVENERAIAPIYNTPEKAGALFVEAFRGITDERVMMLLLNNRGEKIFLGEVFHGSVNSPRLSPATLIRYALMHHASFAYLAHSHTTNLPIPTIYDLTSSDSMQRGMEAAGVPLLNHFLIAGDRYIALSNYHGAAATHGMDFSSCPDMWTDADTTLLPEAEETEKMRAIEEGKGYLASLLSYVDRNAAEEKANRLLCYFPGLAGVFRASCADLMAIEGIKEQEAVLLRVVGALLFRKKPKAPKKNEPVTLLQAAEYVRDLCKGSLHENLCMVFLDEKDCFIDAAKISEGVANSAPYNPRQLLEAVLYRRADRVIIAHTHPDGNPYPSEPDIAGTILIRDLFNHAGVTLVEHIIVTENAYYPIVRRVEEDELNIDRYS